MRGRRNPPRFKTIEEAEELSRRGYFADPETYRISKQIRRDFDTAYDEVIESGKEDKPLDGQKIKTEVSLINHEISLKKKWWQIWK
jgi:hypothetical protein